MVSFVEMHLRSKYAHYFCTIPRFYIFTDVSAQFMYTLNFMASLLCMVEVAEPGFESITYSLVSYGYLGLQNISYFLLYLLCRLPQLVTL